MRYQKPPLFLLFIALFVLPLVPASQGVSQRHKVSAILEQEADQLTPVAREEISITVSEVADFYQIDPLLILAMIKVESDFNPAARSGKDARGLMQIRPIVVREVAGDLGLNARDHKKLFLADFNIRIGVHYLSGLIRDFDGDLTKALMAYNVGPTAIARLYKSRPVPGGGYQGKVLTAYRLFSNS